MVEIRRTAASVNEPLFLENREHFPEIVPAKGFDRRKWQLEHRTFDVINEDMKVVGINQRVFRRRNRKSKPVWRAMN